MKKWSILSSMSCILCLVIFTLFGVFGYLLFGSKLDNNILNNFPTTNIFAVIARVIYCFTAGLTYPVAFFVVRHVCFAVYHYQENRKIRHCGIGESLWFTIPIFIITVVISCEINNLGFVMSLSGSVPSVILVFIMPSLCYLKLTHSDARVYASNHSKKFGALILLLFGIFVGVFSTSLTIIQQVDILFTT